MFSYPLFLAYLFLMSCASHTSTTTTSQSVGYSEDLTAWRPKAEQTLDTVAISQPVINKPATYVEPRYNINKQLDNVLDSISRINLSQRYVDGFTIQIYSGSKREEALRIKKQLMNALPEIQSEVQFIQPNFRVKAGKYVDRLEAQKDYMAVKNYFPNAIVLPDRVAIN